MYFLLYEVNIYNEIEIQALFLLRIDITSSLSKPKITEKKKNFSIKLIHNCGVATVKGAKYYNDSINIFYISEIGSSYSSEGSTI